MQPSTVRKSGTRKDGCPVPFAGKPEETLLYMVEGFVEGSRVPR